MVAAVRALEALAHERTVTRLKQGSDDGSLLQNDSAPLPYDPASVFLLETMVSIACQAPQYIQDLWCVNGDIMNETRFLYLTRPIVFEHLSALLSTSTQYSVLLVERAVVSLLRICLILAQKVSKASSNIYQFHI